MTNEINSTDLTASNVGECNSGSMAGAGLRETLRALHGRVCGDLRARAAWLDRQGKWYQMRHEGVRRRNKPFPNAADLHFPLADSIIEKLKPFYFNQLFATETVAQFVAASP